MTNTANLQPFQPGTIPGDDVATDVDTIGNVVFSDDFETGDLSRWNGGSTP